jgi:Ala-tRNA(Pro) deacylase
VTGDPVPASEAAGRDVYDRLIADLDASGARYRLIEHAPEGRTELVSEDYLRLARPRLVRIIAT